MLHVVAMRLATWNINGTKARIDYIAHWLRAVEPDIVALQELKIADDKFPHDAIDALGYSAVVHGQKSWNGVAVLTKKGADVEVVQRGLPGQEELGARLIAIRSLGLSFVSVYCPNGKNLEHADYARKLAWFDALAEWIAASFDPETPLVVTGDFNVVPEPIDSWDEEGWAGKIFHTEAERARHRRLLEWGLSDIWRALRPEDPGHSWWDYRAGRFHKRQGLRIDLILASRPVLERARSIELSRDWRKKIDGLIPSDHAPVWADLADP